MMHPLPRTRCVGWLCLLVVAIASGGSRAAANPALDGYTDYKSLTRQVAKLAQSKWVTASSLGMTLGGRKVHLLTIGSGQTDKKPAVLIVGNVNAAHLAGSELTLRVAERVVARADNDRAVRELLQRYTLYVIPRPDPDGSEKCFQRPWREPSGNARRTDDDRDGRVGEDPTDDLNRDGWITMMRVRDDAGAYMPHPDDPRVLIKADPRKNERGMYRLLTEGRDNDGDEKFNEDGAGGVAFHRNFTFRYPYFGVGAGPNQVSEPETRAVADFAFDRGNIAIVLVFSPHDNLMHPWKPNPAEKKARIKTAVLSSDAGHLDFIAAKYRQIIGKKDSTTPPPGAGSFSQWAYFHYGRWSLATRGWSIPDPDADAKDAVAKDAVAKDDDTKDDDVKDVAKEKAPSKVTDKKPAAGDRGRQDLAALRWFAKQGIDGFVEWRPVEHPDFPGKVVEVGGFKPFYRLNPPVAMLEEIAEKHQRFLVEVLGLMSRVEIREASAESLGGGVVRVRATVLNSGYLPTAPKMGELSRQIYPLQIELVLPKEYKLLRGPRRVQIPILSGNGGRGERTWLIRGPKDRPGTATIRVWAPAVGSVQTEVQWK